MKKQYLMLALLFLSSCSTLKQQNDEQQIVSQEEIKRDFIFLEKRVVRIQVVKKGDKYGYFQAGKIPIPCIYDDARPFVVGGDWAAVKKADKWSFVDRNGQERLPFIYEDAKSFTGLIDLAGVKKGGKWGFIDKKGQTTIPFIYDDVAPFYMGLARVEKDGQYGYINEQGEMVIPLTDDMNHPKHQHRKAELHKTLYPMVKNYSLHGYCDSTGQVVIPFIYEGAYDFWDGLAVVKKDDGSGFINSTGKEVIPPVYHFATHCNEDKLLKVQFYNLWGFINHQGQEVIPLTYERLYCFRADLAAARKDQKWGFINRADQTVIPFIYDRVSDFDGGSASVKKDGKWFSINKKGECIKRCE